MIELSPREKVVFEGVVRGFVESSNPVGSRTLAKRVGIGVCPATIRNIMADLEEKGFLTQPHTSAGRVPTSTGYRYYVNHLMTIGELDEEEKQLITSMLSSIYHEMDFVLNHSSQVLGNLSSQIGVVLAPRFHQGVLERIELVPLSDRRILVVISIRSGLVKTITLQIDSEFSRETMEETARVLNERLAGLTVQEVLDSLEVRTRGLGDDKQETIVRKLVSSAETLFDVSDSFDIYLTGAQNILTQPEFATAEKLLPLIKLLEDKDLIVHFFRDRSSQERVSISIGEEHGVEVMQNCSIITSTYNCGHVVGTLGVIGPTRMPYDRLVAIVDFTAETISNILNN